MAFVTFVSETSSRQLFTSIERSPRRTAQASTPGLAAASSSHVINASLILFSFRVAGAHKNFLVGLQQHDHPLGFGLRFKAIGSPQQQRFGDRGRSSKGEADQLNALLDSPGLPFV